MQDFGEDVILGVKEHEKWIQIKPTYRPCNFHQSLDLRCVAKCCFCGSSDKVRGIPTQIYQRYMIDFP